MLYSPAFDRLDPRESSADDWAEVNEWHVMMDEAEALAEINGELAIAGMEDEGFLLT